MCVAALAWQTHPRWRLVAIGNRDEYHHRPAAALAQWDDSRNGGSIAVAGERLEYLTNRPNHVRTTLGHGVTGARRSGSGSAQRRAGVVGGWATEPAIDVAAIDALEAVVKHDVIAFLTWKGYGWRVRLA